MSGATIISNLAVPIILVGILGLVLAVTGILARRKAIIRGENKRVFPRVLVGLLMFIPMLIIIISQPAIIKWYHYRPASWVIEDFKSGDKALKKQASRELLLRIGSDRLSSSSYRVLVDYALNSIKGSGNADKENLICFLELAHMKEQMSPSQLDEFIALIGDLAINIDADKVVHGLIQNPDIQKKLAELALDFQGRDLDRANVSTYSLQKYLDFLDYLRALNILSQSQQSRFVEQMALTKLLVRPWIVQGDPLPFKLDVNARVPGKPYSLSGEGDISWLVQMKGYTLYLGEQRIEKPYALHLNLLDNSKTVNGAIECPLPPGKHTLTLEVAISVYRSDAKCAESSKPVLEKTVTLTGNFEVLAERPRDQRSPAVNSFTENELRESLKPARFRIEYPDYTEGEKHLAGVICLHTIPVDISCDLFFKVGDQEFRGGPFIMSKEQPLSEFSFSYAYDGPDVDSIDMVLRSNYKYTKRTVDMFTIWEGELELKDIPIAHKSVNE